METNLSEGINDKFNNKALFVVGSPGAGKNTVVEHLNLVNHGLKMADIDQVRGYLSNADKAISNRVSLWKKNKIGLIINITGREPTLVESLQHDLEDHGYSTFMLFVDVPAEIAWERAVKRSEQTNRTVDRTYFDQVVETVGRTKEYYKWLFGKYFADVSNVGALDSNKTFKQAKADIIKWLLTKSA